MLFSDDYFMESLNGLNESELIMTILRLKKEIFHIKNSIERRSIGEIFPIDQTELNKISLYREKMQNAKKLLAEIGGEYHSSADEIYVEKFQKNTRYTTISFDDRWFFEGFDRYEASIKEQDVYITHTSNELNHSYGSNIYLNKRKRSKFICQLQHLYMGEWRRVYSATRFGIDILDGVSWEVRIQYQSESAILNFSGKNSFPYNFSELQRLFGIPEEKLAIDKYV